MLAAEACTACHMAPDMAPSAGGGVRAREPTDARMPGCRHGGVRVLQRGCGRGAPTCDVRRGWVRSHGPNRDCTVTASCAHAAVTRLEVFFMFSALHVRSGASEQHASDWLPWPRHCLWHGVMDPECTPSVPSLAPCCAGAALHRCRRMMRRAFRVVEISLELSALVTRRNLHLLTSWHGHAAVRS